MIVAEEPVLLTFQELKDLSTGTPIMVRWIGSPEFKLYTLERKRAVLYAAHPDKPGFVQGILWHIGSGDQDVQVMIGDK